MKMPTRMPVVFFGHGNPMNALVRNGWSEAWAAIGTAVPRPRAVLCISAHWYLPGTFVTAMQAPRTIHDFGGFPQALYQVQYPAPGDPELARRVQEMLAPLPVGRDESWGLDHGTWSVFCHVYPDAGVPIVQLSIDETQPAAFHFELGKKLAPLRDEGVLIAGSGNLVHNLRKYAWGRHMPDPYDWALRFEARVMELVLAGEYKALVDYEKLGQDAWLSIPTPDHYLPLLYVLATSRQGDAVIFPVGGIDGGSLSMLTVRIG
jgi:4,5-DOPA dioxygenase extradiol